MLSTLFNLTAQLFNVATADMVFTWMPSSLWYGLLNAGGLLPPFVQSAMLVFTGQVHCAVMDMITTFVIMLVFTGQVQQFHCAVTDMITTVAIITTV